MALIDRERLVCIGVVVGAHGLKGEVKVKPLTGTPGYYERTTNVIVDAGHGLQPRAVRSFRSAGAQWVIGLEGSEERDAALALKGAQIFLEEQDLRPLEEGEYFLDDLIGCRVELMDGTVLGEVTGVLETGANDVLAVATANGELLVPVTAEVVREMNTRARQVRIVPLPGMLDGDDPAGGDQSGA